MESERLEKNRILRAEIKELTAKKKTMTQSEIISSKIVQQIKDKREEINKNNGPLYVFVNLEDVEGV